MAKERNQDLSGPADEALEEHVRELMDVNVPDAPTAPPVSSTNATAPSKPISITVTEHDPELDAVIEATNSQLAEQTGTAPLVPKGPKKLEIIQFDEAVESVEPTSTDVVPEAIESEVPETEVDEVSEPVVEDELEESPLESEIESPETDKAVADIIATESDLLLTAHDEKLAAVAPVKVKKKSLLKRWLHSSGARWTTFLVVFLILAGVFITPDSRYYILNAAGVRSAASLTVLDRATQQPLKNVTVKLADTTAQTDAEGKVAFTELRLGATELVIERRAFADITQAVTIGWGSNPLGNFNLVSEGNQYVFTVTDAFSGNPVGSAEAALGESTAAANDQGEIILTLDNESEDTVSVTIKAPGYRDEIINAKVDTKEKMTVSLVPDRKVGFISKRSGTFDLYTIDADGKNESLILKGTGSESQDLVLAPHPVMDMAVLVSTRDGKRSNSGSSLYSLMTVKYDDKSTKTVIESPQIKLIDWVGSRIVYVYMEADANDEDPSRYKLMSYDYISGDNRQLAVANYFNDVTSVEGKIYYSPASAYQNGVNVGVFAVQPDGSGKQPIFNQEAWNVLRTAHDKLTFAVQQDWYEYVVGSNEPKKLSGQPNSTTSRVYVDSPDSTKSSWIDTRDGKGTIVLYDEQSKKETTILSQTGVQGPIRWLNNDVIVYRVATPTETANYVLSTTATTPKKVSDVTNVSGIDRWTY
jgi:hypothetical protein